MKIENKFIGKIFDYFDFPIRFVYARTGFVSSFLNKMMFWKLYASEFDKLDDKFEQFFVHFEKSNVNVEGKVVLELGPGNSYINAYNFLMKGAKKVILVDRYPRYIETEKQKQYIKDELDFVMKKYGVDSVDFVDGDGMPKKDRIEFIDGDILEMDLKSDIVFSVSVLEHVTHLDKIVQKLADILSPGGIMCHHVDLRDHYNFNSPFLFYKYSDRVWNHYLTKVGGSYTNRVRYDEMMGYFDDAGLTVVDQQVERFPLPDLDFDSLFDGRKNLDVGLVDVVLKKPH